MIFTLDEIEDMERENELEIEALLSEENLDNQDYMWYKDNQRIFEGGRYERDEEEVGDEEEV